MTAVTVTKLLGIHGWGMNSLCSFGISFSIAISYTEEEK